jgi:transcriptional regulator with XRE-family HTH domain
MTNLEAARVAKGWSRAELARRAGLNQVTVGQIEARRLVPYESQLRKLAKALRVGSDDPDWLTQATENPAV